MEYNDKKAIYLQIADLICEKVLSKVWVGGNRIPSVRELAADFEVNPNTVMRTYNYLQQEEIIFNKRGIGYFMDENAFSKTKELKRREFLSTELPGFVKTINLLDYSIEEINKLIKKEQDENK